MSYIRFWNVANLTLPASPGDVNTNFTIQPTDWGNSGNSEYMGIRFPWISEATQTNPDIGIGPESSFQITRYRFVVIGAQGLRAGVYNPYINGLQMQMGREVQRQGGLLFPMVQVGEWEDVDILWKASEATARDYFVPQHLASQISFDTTNLQDIYYGRPIKLLFEIEGHGSLVEGV